MITRWLQWFLSAIELLREVALLAFRLHYHSASFMLVSLRWVVKATHVWILTRPVLAVGHMRNGVQSYLLEWCKVPHCRWAQLISKMGDCVMVKHTFYLAIPFVCNRFLFHFPLNVLALVIFVLKGSGCSIHSPPVAVIWWLARRLFSVLWVPFSALPLLVGPVKNLLQLSQSFSHNSRKEGGYTYIIWL